MMKVLLLLLLPFLVIIGTCHAANKPNCGFKCFRWERCMKQLAGNENRPRQLGDTGIIVLTKCDMGSCDCNQVQKPNSKSKTKVTPQKPRNFASSSTAGQTPKQRRLPTFNRNRSPDRHEESSSGTESSGGFIRRPFRNLLRSRLQPTTTTQATKATPGSIGDDAPREVKFTDDNGRVRIGTVTGTSVSSSVSVSTSTNNDEDIKGTIIY